MMHKNGENKINLRGFQALIWFLADSSFSINVGHPLQEFGHVYFKTLNSVPSSVYGDGSGEAILVNCST
jgi:hypothetical protein